MKDTYKVSGYADDIAIICKSDIESVNEVFYEYERLTKLSGLELNADKTEILILNNQPLQNAYHISYLNDNYVLYPVSNIKICGLFYSKDENVEYKHNVLDKISKLEGQLKKWTIRNLSFEGKVLIVKTFGLSQLIYNMQCYEIKMEELIKIERLIFKFIWSKKWSTNRPVERIRRTFLKNAYEEGGVNAPDVECLDRALKLKQFLRSDNSNHPIKELQKYLLNSKGYDKTLNQEYSKFVESDPITKISQNTINILTDCDRLNCYGGMAKAVTSNIAIDLVSSINIEEYLMRKGRVFIYCNYKLLKDDDILTLKDILLEQEISHNSSRNIRIENTLSQFDNKLIDVAKCFREEFNCSDIDKIYFVDTRNELNDASSLSVKEFQKMLKIALRRVEKLDVTKRNNLDIDFNMQSIMTFRKQCGEIKMRNTFYRLINGDFFTAVRMVKFKMIESPECVRCGEIETNNHLLYECMYSRRMWNQYNFVIKDMLNSTFEVKRKEDIFNFEIGHIENIIKIRLINELIQIERPKIWTKEKIINMIVDTRNCDKYIAIKNNQDMKHFNNKWGRIKVHH